MFYILEICEESRGINIYKQSLSTDDSQTGKCFWVLFRCVFFAVWTDLVTDLSMVFYMIFADDVLHISSS